MFPSKAHCLKHDDDNDVEDEDVNDSDDSDDDSQVRRNIQTGLGSDANTMLLKSQKILGKG